MSTKFSALALLAMSNFNAVAQAEYELEQARDEADKSAEAVVSALKSLPPPHRVALVDEDCDVSIYTLQEDGEGYKVEFIPGDFDVPDREGDEPTAPVEPEPEPEPVFDAFAEFAVS